MLAELLATLATSSGECHIAGGCGRWLQVKGVNCGFCKISRIFRGSCSGPLFQNFPDISIVVVYEMSRTFWKNGLQNKYPGYFGKVIREPFIQNIPDFFGRPVPTKNQAAKALVQAICWLSSNPPNTQDFMENPSGRMRPDGKRRKHLQGTVERVYFALPTKIGRKPCLGLDENPASTQGSRLGFVVFRGPRGPKTSQIDTVGLHVWGLENIANTVGLDFWEHENNANTMGLNVWAQKHRKYRETRCLRANQPQAPFLGARNSLSTANTVGLGLQLEAERCRTLACVLCLESCRAGCWQGVVCVFVRMLPYPLLFRLQVVTLVRNVPMLWLKVPLRG